MQAAAAVSSRPRPPGTAAAAAAQAAAAEAAIAAYSRQRGDSEASAAPVTPPQASAAPPPWPQPWEARAPTGTEKPGRPQAAAPSFSDDPDSARRRMCSQAQLQVSHACHFCRQPNSALDLSCPSCNISVCTTCAGERFTAADTRCPACGRKDFCTAQTIELMRSAVQVRDSAQQLWDGLVGVGRGLFSGSGGGSEAAPPARSPSIFDTAPLGTRSMPGFGPPSPGWRPPAQLVAQAVTSPKGSPGQIHVSM